MNLQIEINGEPYSGYAYTVSDGLLIHLPGVQSPHAPAFTALFQPLPGEIASGGYIEVGEWDGKAYQFETQVNFCLGPDGKVWAQICNPSNLPLVRVDPTSPDQANIGRSHNKELAFRILDEAEEAFGAKSTAEERAACRGWNPPITVGDYLFWLEDEAANQLDDRQQATYAKALRGVCRELRGLGFRPSPPPCQGVKEVAPGYQVGDLFEQQTLDRLQTRARALGYLPNEVIYSLCWDDVLSVLAERLAREALATDLLDDDDLERLLERSRKGLDNSLPWYDTLDILLDLDLPEGLDERAVARQPDGRCVTRLFWDCHCEEGYIHPVTLVDCPACGAHRDESPLSSADNVLRSAQEWNLDQGLVACVRRAYPVSWDFDPVGKVKHAIQLNEEPLAEQHVNSNRSQGAVPLTADDWLESAYEDTVSGWSDEF